MDRSEPAVATPAALMALREECQVVKDGHRFLDEKRLLLAAEILRQLDDYQRHHDRYLALHREAAAALAAATVRHGLQGLQVYPAVEPERSDLHLSRRTFLGVQLVSSLLEWAGDMAADAFDPSPEARHCAHLFRELVQLDAALAGIHGNLERLQVEYRRTERRARALEDVILPELQRSLEDLAVRLEEMDQEEAVRVRLDYGKRRG